MAERGVPHRMPGLSMGSVSMSWLCGTGLSGPCDVPPSPKHWSCGFETTSTPLLHTQTFVNVGSADKDTAEVELGNVVVFAELASTKDKDPTQDASRSESFKEGNSPDTVSTAQPSWRGDDFDRQVTGGRSAGWSNIPRPAALHLPNSHVLKARTAPPAPTVSKHRPESVNHMPLLRRVAGAAQAVSETLGIQKPRWQWCLKP